MTLILSPGQEAGLAMVGNFLKSEDAVAVLTGYAGTGKAQPLDSVVYTPGGPKRMGDLKVGDFVCTPDGGRAPILSIHPQGLKDVWKFILDDGAEVLSSGEHLWTVIDRTKLSNLRKFKTGTRTYTTDYIVSKLPLVDGTHRFYIPTTKAVDYDAAVLPIDPYLLGLLLGDGHFHKGGVSLSSADEVLVAECESLLAQHCCELNHVSRYDFRIRGVTGRGKTSSARPFLQIVKTLGLWDHLSYEKFIPPRYLVGSVRQRMALLQGLMDTDGTVDHCGMASFCTTSPQLADDVRTLARSLGAKVTTSTRITHYTYKGVKKAGRLSYLLRIGLNNTKRLFRLHRKIALATARTKFQTQLCIRTAEFVGQVECQCILIDHPDHLYLTDHFIPTHNTTLIKVIAEAHGEPVVLTPTGKASLRVTEATGIPAKTIHRFLYDAATDYKTGAPVFILKDIWEMTDYKGHLVLIDEASMVSKELWDDLLLVAKQANFKILLMGDLFQLAPVSKVNEGFSALDIQTEHRINLTDVVRQALGSPIIRASMLLRSNRPESEAFQLLTAVGESQLLDTVLETHGRNGFVICHTNKRRHWLNNLAREGIGFAPDTLNEGEPLLVTKNNYNLDRYNGEVVTFDRWTEPPCQKMTRIATDRYTTSSMSMAFGVANVEDNTAMLSVDEITGKAADGKIGDYAIKKAAKVAYGALGDYEKAPPYLHSNYGYALTCHKSQGSEAPEVLMVLEDSLNALRGNERKRWMYTAITRSKETVKYVYLSEHL